MNIFLLSWIATSVAAYIMLYITERKMPKGFTPFDAWFGFIMCAIPYIFFILFSLGLFFSLNEKKPVEIKRPTITKEDMENYQKKKRKLKKEQAA